MEHYVFFNAYCNILEDDGVACVLFPCEDEARQSLQTPSVYTSRACAQ